MLLQPEIEPKIQNVFIFFFLNFSETHDWIKNLTCKAAFLSKKQQQMFIHACYVKKL